MATRRVASESRLHFPRPPSTPGDRAPIALDDFAAHLTTKPPLPSAPALPSGASLSRNGRLTSTPVCSLAHSWDRAVPLSVVSTPASDLLRRPSVAFTPDDVCLRDQEPIAYRDGQNARCRERDRECDWDRRVDKRLQELGVLLDGLAEEGQTAWRRLDELEQVQRVLADDIKGAVAMAEGIRRNMCQLHASNIPAGELIELRKDVRALSQAHGRRNCAIEAMREHWLRWRLSDDEELQMRRIMCLWHEVASSSSRMCKIGFTSQCAEQSQGGMIPAAPVDDDLHTIIVAGLAEHENRLARLDEQIFTLLDNAGLHSLDNDDKSAISSKTSLAALMPSAQSPPGKVITKIEKLLNCAESQAQTVGDLEFLVREELRSARAAVEKAQASQQRPLQEFREELLEQGCAIESLRAGLDSNAISIDVGSPVSLVSRVDELENSMDTTRQQLSSLVAVVRQVRDHAADAFEDRVTIAVAEVRQRMVDCVTGVHERIHALRRQTGLHNNDSKHGESGSYLLDEDASSDPNRLGASASSRLGAYSD